MAIRIMPQAAQDPVRSQAGGVQGRVEPLQDQTGRQMQALGAGVQQLGQGVTQYADAKQDQITLAMSARMQNLFNADYQEIMEKPETGYLNTIGMDARGKRKYAFAQLQASRRKIEQMAEDEAQRANFSKWADHLEARAVALADRHQDQQMRTFHAGELDVRAKASLAEGVKLFGTVEGDAAVESAMRDIDQQANLLGWPADSVQRREAKRNAMGSVHAGRVEAMVEAGNAAGAAAYVKQFGKEMPEPLSRRAQSMIRDGLVDEESSRLAVEVSATVQAQFEASRKARAPEYQDEPPTELERADAWDKMRSLVDDRWSSGKISRDVRNAAREALDKEQDGMEKRIASRRVLVEREAKEWLAANPNSPVSTMPKPLLSDVRGAGLTESINAFAASGNRSTDTPEGMTRLDRLTDDDLRMVDENQIRSGFSGLVSDKTMDRLLKRHKEVTSAEGRSRRGKSDPDRIEAKARELGIIPGTKGSPWTETQTREWDVWSDGIDSKMMMVQEGGKKLDDKGFVDLLNRHAIEWKESTVTRQGYVFDSDVTIRDYENYTEDDFVMVGQRQVFLRNIPPDVYRGITTKLVVEGTPVTPKSIAAEWISAGEPKKVRR